MKMHGAINEFYLFMITGRYAGTSLWNSAVHHKNSFPLIIIQSRDLILKEEINNIMISALKED